MGVYSSYNPGAFLKGFKDCMDQKETLQWTHFMRSTSSEKTIGMSPKRSILLVKWHILWGLLFSKEQPLAEVPYTWGSGIHCCAAKAGVCIWEAFLHTYRRVLVHKCICLSLMWCVLWTDPVSHWMNGWWVKLQAYSWEYQFAWACPCFEADYCSQQTAAFSPSFIFFSMKTVHTLPLWGVPCDARNTSLSVLYVALAPEEANGKHWRLMVLSTLLGSLLDQPHKLCSLFLLSTLSPVWITLAPALQR